MDTARRHARDLVELLVAYGHPPGLSNPRRPLEPHLRSVVTPPPARQTGADGAGRRGGSLGPVAAPATIALRAAVPGDGQSTVALGLAVAWAAVGARVLLVDLSGGEDLARALHLGRATAAEHAADLLTALSRGEAPVPAPTALEGVAVVSGGSTLALEPDAVADAVLRRSSEVRRALVEASRGHTHVLLDGPAWPPGYARAVENLADHVLEVSEADPLPGPTGQRRRGGPTRAGHPALGTVLNRWSETDGPDATWLATALESGRWLDTTLPRADTLRGLWDLVDGRCGAELDTAFVQLARELDARIARGPT